MHIDILDKQPVSRICLTALSHDTRDRLTRWITGHERNEIATPYLIKKMLGFPQNDQPSIYWFLTSPEVGDSVVHLIDVVEFANEIGWTLPSFGQIFRHLLDLGVLWLLMTTMYANFRLQHILM